MTAEGVHKARLGQQRQEIVRHHQAAGGVLPAGQRLEPGEAPGLKLGDGLEERHDLTPPEGAVQIRLQRQARQAVGAGPWRRAGHGGLAGRLGGVQGEGGAAQEFGGVGCVCAAVGPGLGDPQSGMDVEALDPERPLHGRPQHAASIACLQGVVDQKGEFVLADARGQGFGREGAGETRGQGLQHHVRAGGAEGLVQPAQPRQIRGDQPDAAGRFQPLVQSFEEALPVDQPGQGVTPGFGEGLRGADHPPPPRRFPATRRARGSCDRSACRTARAG